MQTILQERPVRTNDDPDDNGQQAVNADCYSAGERRTMLLTQELRGRWLGPLLSALERLGVTPNHLTLLSNLAGLAFCPLYFWSKPVAFGMLMLHVLLDGLDGPLARQTGLASRQGSFTDTMSDQIVVVLSTITLMFSQTISVLPGGLYIFLYTVVVLFAMARNVLSIPYSWLVRPRFFIYGWLIVETWFLPGTINVLLWIANLLLGWKMLTGFVHIRRKI